MPKMKSHRASKKRMKLTSKGKVKKHSPFTSHLMSSKSAKRRRNLRKGSILAKSDTKKLRLMLA